MSRVYHEGEVDHPPLGAGGTLAPGYEVLAHLHQSDSYDVYSVWSEERACRCVAKTLRQDLLSNGGVTRDLLAEGRLLEGLTHPHVVRLYEIVAGPPPALILETLTGETLAHIIDTSYRRLPLKDVVHLGLHLCSAVRYLHGRGVLHLDLKPSNVVSERGLAKILDLSLARPSDPQGESQAGAGTAQYMAPEQVRGGTLGPPTDVWGIGAVLFEAATAEPPFNAGDEYETASEEADRDEGSGTAGSAHGGAGPEDYEQLRRRADPVGEYRRVPAAFTDVIGRCLEPEPERRPTVEDLMQTLTSLV